MSIHPILIKRHEGMECPPCYDNQRPLHVFTSSRALMTHIAKAHTISKEESRTIRRLARIYEKSSHESFLRWMQSRGQLK